MTTFEPGASEVLTHGLRASPRASALRARIPAPIITDGFDVFVQLVIAAITTCPWSSSNVSPSIVTVLAVPLCGSAVAVLPSGSCGTSTVAASSACPGSLAGGSDAGYDSAMASSCASAWSPSLGA